MAETNGCNIVLDPRKRPRDGTSQQQRALAALAPQSVKVDEHGLADWMVFAEQYARYNRFYDLTDQVAGDWQVFFNRSSFAVLAKVAVQDSAQYKRLVADLFNAMRLSETAAQKTHAIQALNQAFNLLASLCVQFEQLLQRLDDTQSLKGLLQNSIRNELRWSLGKLIAYYKAIDAAALSKRGCNAALQLFNAPLIEFADFGTYNLSDEWYQASAPNQSWSDYVEQIAADNGVIGSGHLLDSDDQLQFAGQYNPFNGVFDTFGKVYARVIAEARLQLEQQLGKARNQSPHYALFLAFLRLLESVRDQINTLSERHLDYYYREVLQLSPKALQASQAHVSVQLAKHQSSALLERGRAFNAGKDSLGQAVDFVVEQDTSINLAQVSALKSVRQAEQTLYAFPFTNSADGLGAALSEANPAWSLFDTPRSEAARAPIGFTIASHYLLLNEGLRSIRLNLRFQQTVSQQAFCDSFEFFVSGAKGWIQAQLNFAAPGASTQPRRNVAIPLLIDGKQAAIVALDNSLHGNSSPAGLPTLQLRLKANAALSLDELRQLTLVPGETTLEVAVGYAQVDDEQPEKASGLRTLQLYNSQGQLKADQPFMPFGAQPKIGDYLLIGNDELTQKAGAQFRLHLNWKGLPDWRGNIDLDWVNEFAPNVGLSWLQDGHWGERVRSLELFDDTQAAVSVPAKGYIDLPAEAASEAHADTRRYDLSQRNGFFKLSLNGDFGHALYQPTLARYLIRLTQDPQSLNGVTLSSLRNEVYNLDNGRYVPKNPYQFQQDFIEHFSKLQPLPPYTPELDSVSISYKASVELAQSQLFWLTSFGYLSADTGATALQLLPVVEGLAEFYIGLQKAKPTQNVSLLFQVLEGSANPTVAKPQPHIEWSYLSENQWRAFSELQMSDATAQLTRSGIIRFSLPADASDDDSLMLSDATHWIRGTITQAPDAVCQLLSVSAQAVLLQFQNQNNAADFLNTPLAAGSIQKLRTPDATIKKVEQPYDSFGGRSAEADAVFYNRVSERLRHKNRAIMPWDYERLLLEAFPSIYKVKCLNHTLFEPASAQKAMTYHELAAGHVTLVTLPDLKNRHAVDPLRPYTNLGDLEAIRTFLQPRLNPFVKLHVHNPLFEAVATRFKVKLNAGVDEALHVSLLQQALMQFLSPWAFDQATDIQFGGRVFKSALINFVEEQAYVDYLTDFELFSVSDSGIEGPNVDQVEASTAISILVSVAAEQHQISALPQTVSNAQAQVCSC